MIPKASRINNIDESQTIAITNLVAELRSEGEDVVDLSVGEPDFQTPENIVDAGRTAMESGKTTYTPSKGIPQLRQEIANKYEAYGISYSPEEIIVTPGAKQAIFEAVQACVDPGDEVILCEPSWVSYRPIVRLAGGDTISLDLQPHNFHLEPALDELKTLISDDTRALILNSPNNPTGAVYSQNALETLRDLAIDTNTVVITDEIYEAITYDDQPISIASLDGMRERTITINGFSKAYSMTGWRLGYMAAPTSFISAAAKIHSHTATCATNFVQHAGVEALRNTTNAVDEMVAAFEKRRNVLVDLLAEYDVTIQPPEGAFYAMVPVAEDDESWCKDVLREVQVATVPGSAFNAPGYARFSYANNTEQIKEGIARIGSNDYF
ncbi:MAG: pyridoxal phosphate-dependent aminotransferase [Halobacteriaceae archaeon]